MTTDQVSIQKSSSKPYIVSVVVMTTLLALPSCGMLLGYENVTNVAVFLLYLLSILMTIGAIVGIVAISGKNYKPSAEIINSVKNTTVTAKFTRTYNNLCLLLISILCAYSGYFLLASVVMIGICAMLLVNKLMHAKIKELGQQSI